MHFHKGFKTNLLIFGEKSCWNFYRDCNEFIEQLEDFFLLLLKYHLPIYESRMTFHLFISLISFNKILQFLVCIYTNFAIILIVWMLMLEFLEYSLFQIMSFANRDIFNPFFIWTFFFFNFLCALLPWLNFLYNI